MNKLQYKRWKDFAIRMVHKGWPRHQVKGKTYQGQVIPAVNDFFDMIEGCFEDEIIRIESWDNTKVDDSKKNPYGRPETGPYVCDIVSEMLSDYNPFYWDGEENIKAYENWDEKWGGRIRACIRAGIDLAAEPSAGVLGFTKADIEKMYPEGVPKWIQQSWQKKNAKWHNIKWKNIPSDGELWL